MSMPPRLHSLGCVVCTTPSSKKGLSSSSDLDGLGSVLPSHSQIQHRRRRSSTLNEVDTPVYVVTEMWFSTFRTRPVSDEGTPADVARACANACWIPDCTELSRDRWSGRDAAFALASLLDTV